MAVATLTEGDKYSTTTLDGKVTDLFVKDSVVLQKLPFEDLPGNSETYDQIATDSTVDFYSPDDEWQEDSAVLSQATVKLRILGGMVDIDNFILKSRSNKIDLQGTQLENKVKAMKNKFLDTFYYGNSTSNPKTFDGLHVLMTSTTYNTVHAGSGTGTALSMAKLYEAVDLPHGIRPEAILMSKKLRRGMQVYLDSIGDKFPTSRDQFGNLVESFQNIPIYIDENIVDTETASSGAYAAQTGGANTTIFIVSFDPYGVCGAKLGSDGIVATPWGELPNKDASRWKVRFYCGLKFKNVRYASKVDGIVAAGTVTA